METPGFLGQVRLNAMPARPASTVAPAGGGTAWWLHHIRNTRAYAEAALAGDKPAALAALGQLWLAVKDWERLTDNPTQGLLIAEHTALAKLLVDCLAAGADPGCAAAAADGLGRNVEAQGQLFPKDPAGFKVLFGPHTALAGAYITALAEGRSDDVARAWGQALQNGQELGAFTDRIFPAGARSR